MKEVVFSLIRFSEYGKGDAVANETEETRKKKLLDDHLEDLSAAPKLIKESDR